MTDLSHDECHILWTQFENKIAREWEHKYKNISREDFSGLNKIKKKKTDISNAVYDDIEKHLKAKNQAIDDLPTKEYFYSLLQKGVSTASHPKTIEMLIYYLDYHGTTEFISSLSTKTKHNLESAGRKLLYKTDKNSVPIGFLKKNRPVLISLGCCLFFILLFFLYDWYSRKYFTKEEINTFRSFIDRAGEAEYNLYQNPDTNNLVWLDEFFTKKGQARESIMGEMVKPLRLGYRLRKLESHRRIIDFEMIEKTKEEIRIQSKEKWKLVWYDPKTGEDLSKYDTTNIQLYLLTKESNIWKIDLNDYQGKKRKLK